jgi:hypothetical protein
MAKNKVDEADGVRVGEEPVPGMRLRCICRGHSRTSKSSGQKSCDFCYIHQVTAGRALVHGDVFRLPGPVFLGQPRDRNVASSPNCAVVC